MIYVGERDVKMYKILQCLLAKLIIAKDELV